MIETKPKIQTLIPWFGSNRTLAHKVGEALKGCRWIGVPFAGGMSELAHINAPTIVVSDVHLHVINLAREEAAIKDVTSAIVAHFGLMTEAWHDVKEKQ